MTRSRESFTILGYGRVIPDEDKLLLYKRLGYLGLPDSSFVAI